VPALSLRRPTVPTVLRHATGTRRTPPPPRHLDLVAVTRLGLRPDLAAFRSPDGVVPVTGANQCVSEFVENRVENVVVGVAFGEVNGKFDAAGFFAVRVEADAGSSDVRVEPEFPRGEPVFVKQPPCQFSD